MEEIRSSEEPQEEPLMMQKLLPPSYLCPRWPSGMWWGSISPGSSLSPSSWRPTDPDCLNGKKHKYWNWTWAWWASTLTYFYIFPGSSLSEATEMYERRRQPTKQRILLRETSYTCKLQEAGNTNTQLFTHLTSVRQHQLDSSLL